MLILGKFSQTFKNFKGSFYILVTFPMYALIDFISIPYAHIDYPFSQFPHQLINKQHPIQANNHLR